MKHIDDVVHPSTGKFHACDGPHAFSALEAAYRAARLPNTPDDKRGQRRNAVYKNGIDTPIVIRAIKRFDESISDLELTLTQAAFVAGPTYSLADDVVTPCTNRLSDLGLLHLWADGTSRVLAWFDTIRAHNSFAQSITHYLTETAKTTFDGIDPETPEPMRRILDTP